jgi:putative addiction module component (TIGR02574 family)
MTEAAEQLLDEAMSLSAEERSELVLRLLAAMGEATPELEAAWVAEARQRLAELDAGLARLSPWYEARARIFAEEEP